MRGGLRWLITCALAATLLPRPVQAEDRDSATVGKITLLNRKAVDAYQHLEFETAVKLLNEALEVSERAGLMLHPSRARTYMTLGIVTLGGYKQRDQAIKDFRKALQIQPEVRLSPGLANPEIQAAFDEAISSLANGASDELPPEKALVHEPVHVGQMGRPVPITVAPDKDLGASAIVLRFRAGEAPVFTDLPMQKSPTGAFEAAIPVAATTGQQVVYFIEARRPDGSVIVRRGSAADPMVVALVEPAKPAAAVATEAAPKAVAAPKSFYFALLVGSGVGTASGTAEVTRNKISSSGLVWTRAGQLAPEIGYFVTPQLRVGVQARLQWVTGATPFHVLVPDPMDPNECGADHTCSPFTGAFAGLAKASWSFLDPERALQLYASLSAGYGTIRHVVTNSAAPPSCGGTPPDFMGTCKDTVAGGPVLFGPGVGLQYRVADGVGLVAELGALVGVPNFTANVDLNVGVAFQL
ncbi:MAG TPA: tetratricopeptide repeat protein [Polyangia bacterium]|nr:tetratricopeptide repeat protein [Polyangia bacterium]